jgi:type I restriction enzyme R subunit
MKPEERARVRIDQLLQAAGWHVCDASQVNLHAFEGVAIREFPLNSGHGFADYLLYVHGKACGVIEAKKEGSTLKGVEIQSERYAQGLPAALPAWRRPLPFLFESTGVETQFTNRLDPQPRSRRVFAFFRPEQLQQWLDTAAPVSPNLIAVGTQPTRESGSAYWPAGTFLARMQRMPELVTQWGQGGASYQLWPAQIKAVQNLEKSLAATPNKQTFGFFNQNLVMEYGHTQAVADGVNVNYDVYRIQTEVTKQEAISALQPRAPLPSHCANNPVISEKPCLCAV